MCVFVCVCACACTHACVLVCMYLWVESCHLVSGRGVGREGEEGVLRSDLRVRKRRSMMEDTWGGILGERGEERGGRGGGKRGQGRKVHIH